MYRDYFETDLEIDPEDEHVEDMIDKQTVAEEGQF